MKVHKIVQQGSGGADLGSALDLALGLEQYFSGEICYGKLRSQPQAWQDDILRIGVDIKSTRVGNAKLAAMYCTFTFTLFSISQSVNKYGIQNEADYSSYWSSWVPH